MPFLTVFLQRVKAYAATQAVAVCRRTMGTARITEFQILERFSGDRIGPAAYCPSVTLSGMNFRLTAFETKPPPAALKITP